MAVMLAAKAGSLSEHREYLAARDIRRHAVHCAIGVEDQDQFRLRLKSAKPDNEIRLCDDRALRHRSP
jgi:hypothetical protein